MSSRPKITRQKSVRAIKKNQKNSYSSTPFLMLPVAIAAVVIAHKYDSSGTTSPCVTPSGTGHYVVELALFLYIGGYFQIAQAAWILALLVWFLWYLRPSDSKKKVSKKKRKEATEIKNKCASLPGKFVGFYYLIWAAIGLYMYDNQMSDECKDEPIAKMVFAWSLIPFCLFGAFCCCMSLACCCAAGILGAAGEFDEVEEDDDDELEHINDKKIHQVEDAIDGILSGDMDEKDIKALEKKLGIPDDFMENAN